MWSPGKLHNLGDRDKLLLSLPHKLEIHNQAWVYECRPSH